MRTAQIARMMAMGNAQQNVNGLIIKKDVKREEMRGWGCNVSGQGIMTGCCKRDNDTSEAIKGSDCLHWLCACSS